MQFLFLLLLIRLIPGAIIFYIVCRDDLQSPITFYQVFYSLVLYDEIQDLKKAIPYFDELIFLHIVP